MSNKYGNTFFNLTPISQKSCLGTIDSYNFAMIKLIRVLHKNAEIFLVCNELFR